MKVLGGQEDAFGCRRNAIGTEVQRGEAIAAKVSLDKIERYDPI
jgi:hypothetical protein